MSLIIQLAFHFQITNQLLSRHLLHQCNYKNNTNSTSTITLTITLPITSIITTLPHLKKFKKYGKVLNGHSIVLTQRASALYLVRLDSTWNMEPTNGLWWGWNSMCVSTNIQTCKTSKVHRRLENWAIWSTFIVFFCFCFFYRLWKLEGVQYYCDSRLPRSMNKQLGTHLPNVVIKLDVNAP